MEYKGYKARVEVDTDAGILHGEVEGIRDVITFQGKNVDELREAFHDSVNDYLAMCAERDEEPEKAYSGKFLVRLDPDLHRELAITASRSGKSLNALAVDAVRYWISQTGAPAKTATRLKSYALEPSIERPALVKAISSVAEARGKAIKWGSHSDPQSSFQRAKTPSSNTPSSETPGSQTPPSQQLF